MKTALPAMGAVEGGSAKIREKAVVDKVGGMQDPKTKGSVETTRGGAAKVVGGTRIER